MDCECIGQAVYALQCAKIRADIFSRIVCRIHSADKPTSTSRHIVSFFFLPDVAVTGSEPIDTWPVAYHGTTVDVIRSIIEHGYLLMAGDVLYTGTVVGKRRAAADQPEAICTYPHRRGAEKVAEKAKYDDGATQFKVLVRVRQSPGTYTVHAADGKKHRYDMWSTNRRGTHYLEALDVYVTKAASSFDLPTPLTVGRRPYITSFKCPTQQSTFEVLQLLNIPQCMFDGSHNRCYCKSCYPDARPSSMIVAGETYAIPRGWTRFGLAVNPVTASVNDIWKSWPIAFHGCHPKDVVSIIKHRSLLIPHDVLDNGTELGVCSSADVNQKRYFLSPAIGYSAHPWYAKPVPFTLSSGAKKRYFQTVFVFKVRPQTFLKQAETEGETMKLYDDYSIIPEDEIEWCSSGRGCTHPYGILIRIIEAKDLNELNEFFKLAQSSPFNQKFEYSLNETPCTAQ